MPHPKRSMSGLARLSLLSLALATFPVHADAYKCWAANGSTLISSQPCDDGALVSTVVRSDNVSPSSAARARADLQRQKRFVAQREHERETDLARYATVTQPRKVSGDASDPETRQRIHSCLMKITATLGLSPTTQAQRKVGCYQGTVGLQGECEGRITATGGLTTNQEQHFRQQCRNLS